MLSVALVSALAVLLVQGCEAKETLEVHLEEDAWGVVQEHVRDVKVRSLDSEKADEERKQSIRDNGFLWTVWEDFIGVLSGPFTWAWSVVTFPFTMSLLSKYRWDIYQENKHPKPAPTPTPES